MLIAWMTLGSLGMMIARYLKGVAKGQNLCGKDVWFLVRLHIDKTMYYIINFVMCPTFDQVIFFRKNKTLEKQP